MGWHQKLEYQQTAAQLVSMKDDNLTTDKDARLWISSVSLGQVVGLDWNGYGCWQQNKTEARW